MNMDGTLKILLTELKHGGFEILPDKIQEKIYRKILLKSKSKSDMIERLQESGFHDEIIMLLIGIVIGLEQKGQWKKSLLPSFLRKK